ncbi:MAG: hypothetical protein JXA28_02630 [Bacteroidetes bacterium]|nr:hypothetical protein [Bacteroidota bacterium]
MFISSISGVVSNLTPNSQTRFQCAVTLTVPQEEFSTIEPGRLIAAENVFHAARDKRYTILQIIDVFPALEEETKASKKSTLTLRCTATPIGQELRYKNAKTGPEIVGEDTFPAFDGKIEVLDDDMTRAVIHLIAPESRIQENGSRIDIGQYRSNPAVNVGLDAVSLLRGNAAVLSARPRARTTIVNTLIQSLLQDTAHPVHVVYCDVNNIGTLSLTPLLSTFERSGILCLNDKFIPPSVFHAMRNAGDRSAHKRAVLDYLDMMILPSVLEQRRHDFTYAISNWMRENRIAIYRPHEQKVDEFINEIRVDILDGVDEEVEEYISELMLGIAETYRGERFTEKNTRDILGMVDEFSQESRSHSARRNLYDLKAEVESVFETYSKDIPASARKSIQDIVTQLNDDNGSSLLVVQGQKTTDILRFIGTLSQTLIEERLKRLKIRVPVLFIFNNIDDYVGRNGSAVREPGSDRFTDTIQTLLSNGRRHGMGFCLTLENAASLDRQLARRVQNYFIGPITFVEEPTRIADLLNISEELLHPAVRYEDGDFLFTSAESPYHRRVPLPVVAPKNSEQIHLFLDDLRVEQERRRQEYMAQDEERRKRQDEERKRQDEERKRQDEERKRQEDQRKQEDKEAKARAPEAEREPGEADHAETKPDASTDKVTTRTRRKRGGRRSKSSATGTKDDPGTKSGSADTPKNDDDAHLAADDTGKDIAVADYTDFDPVDDTAGKDAKSSESPGDTSGTTDEKPAERKSTRGRRGGRGRKTTQKTAGNSDHAADTGTSTTSDNSPKSDTATTSDNSAKSDATTNVPSTEKSDAGRKGGSGTGGWMIEEFDPNANKTIPAEKKADSATERGSSSDAKDDAKTDAPADEKKPARRGTRRRSPRSRKSSSSSSGKKSGEE